MPDTAPAGPSAQTSPGVPATPRFEIPECHDEVCITCSDQGIAAQVIAEPTGPLGLAQVRHESGTEDVDVMLVGPVTVGDWVLIHGGTALTRLEMAR